MSKSNPSLAAVEGQARTSNLVPLSERLLWSATEAAQMCGMSQATFRKYVSLGVFPGPYKGTGKYSSIEIRASFGAFIEGTKQLPSALEEWRRNRG